MFRRLLRLIRVLLPAFIVAAIWSAWWFFGDGPIKVSRRDIDIEPDFPHTGRNTVIEHDHRQPKGVLGPIYWRSLDSGKCLVKPESLCDCKVQVTPDEQTLLAFKDGFPAQLFDRTSGRVRAELPPALPAAGHQNRVLSKDGRTLAYGTTDETVVVVDVPTGKVTHRLGDLQPPVGLSDDGRILVAAQGRQSLVVQDLEANTELARTPCQDAHDLVEHVVGPRGVWVLLTINVAGTTTQEAWSTKCAARTRLATRPWDPESSLTAYGRFVVVSEAGAHRVWSLADGPPSEITSRFAFDTRGPAFSDDGKWVLVLNAAGSAWELFDTDTFAVHCSVAKSTGYFTVGLDRDHRYILALEHVDVASRLNQWTWSIFGRAMLPTMRTHVFDVSNGAHLRSLPSLSTMSITEDGTAVWVKPNFGHWRDGVYELWSLAPRQPPWWLWSLSVIGVVWYVQRIWRWRRTAVASSTTLS